MARAESFADPAAEVMFAASSEIVAEVSPAPERVCLTRSPYARSDCVGNTKS